MLCGWNKSKFVNKHYQKICDKFQINSDRLKKSILEIEKLNPKPASNTNQTKYTEQIIPDFTISIHDDKIDFSLNSRNAPSLNISKDYANMLNLYKETGGEVNKETKQVCVSVYVWKPSAYHGKWNIHAQKETLKF